ncbi:hypothetical protein C8R45DRAFT_980981 [Mycena sanguinolenta]|nr:hypothetical protein C8R45DRAFT_980981 [Mycena sanguinolenta]
MDVPSGSNDHTPLSDSAGKISQKPKPPGPKVKWVEASSGTILPEHWDRWRDFVARAPPPTIVHENEADEYWVKHNEIMDWVEGRKIIEGFPSPRIASNTPSVALPALPRARPLSPQTVGTTEAQDKEFLERIQAIINQRPNAEQSVPYENNLPGKCDKQALLKLEMQRLVTLLRQRTNLDFSRGQPKAASWANVEFPDVFVGDEHFVVTVQLAVKKGCLQRIVKLRVQTDVPM